MSSHQPSTHQSINLSTINHQNSPKNDNPANLQNNKTKDNANNDQTSHKKTVVVLGLGASGLSVVHYLYQHLYQHGEQVLVMDMNSSPVLTKQLPNGVATHFGGFDSNILTQAKKIIISPGVNPDHPAIVEAKQAGVPIVSDIQLFADECHARGIDIVAITGSNAKSTVTTLVGQMASDAGLSVGVGGNIGIPALSLLEKDIKIAVLELSSFQLEAVTGLGAKVATILNLSADHLDRHGTMENYLTAKLRIFDGAKVAIVNKDDSQLFDACQAVFAGKDYVVVQSDNSDSGDNSNSKGDGKNSNSKNSNGKLADDGLVDYGLIDIEGQLWLAKNNTPLLASDDLLIKGKHNLTNALFALAIGEQMGITMASMLKTLQAFAGLPHRCQFVKTVAGCDYFNDSKGTNIGATLAAILGLGAVYGERSLVLLLGGQAKGQVFGEMADWVNRYGHSVVCFGQDGKKIADDLTQAKTTCPIIQRKTLFEAVQTASLLNAPCVLLSPACASFDEFLGYSDRGERFVAMVQALGD